MTFNEKDTELEYEVNANATAALNTWNVNVLAESSGPTGVTMTASPFIQLTVEEPFVGMKLSMATAKQGETSSIVADVEHLRDFDGEADVQIFGLPAHSTTSVLKLKKGLENLNFPVATTEKTPVGQHKNLFCTVVVMKNGEPISQRVGMGGVFRVDPKPKEVKAAPAEAKPKVVAKVEKKEKPLSRLEQLRLEAKKEAAAP